MDSVIVDSFLYVVFPFKINTLDNNHSGICERWSPRVLGSLYSEAELKSKYDDTALKVLYDCVA